MIVIKKKGRHATHHGGAWKVAYADFVTAMMALFIVLWLLDSSKPIQNAVGGYFRDPHGTAEKRGTSFGGAGDAKVTKKEDMTRLKDAILASLRKMPGFDKLEKHVEFVMTPEGLRIELLEDAKGTFFENGSAEPKPPLVDVLKVLSVDIGKLPNQISIEGHTDAKPYAAAGGYSNWELSSDRANMARRLMEASGLRGEQVTQVRGYADRQLRHPDQPFDPSNRRVSVIVQYMEKNGKQLPLLLDEAHSVPKPDAAVVKK
ncbi:OmpA family protein [Granulicella sp. 5B5]|nr:OmpA family protein [Granulicella sp. 5B5]